MSGTAIATLQYYTPELYNVLVTVVMSAFLLGLLTVLSVVSTGHLIRRGVKRPSTAFMLGSVLVLYASTVTHLGLALAHSAGYVRVLNDSVVALSSMFSVWQTASGQFGDRARAAAHIISLVLAINLTLGDAIVWWRVCVLCQWRKRSTIAFGVVLITCTFVFGVLSTVHWPRVEANVDIQPLMSYGDMYGGASGLLSFITNVTATSLIGRKAWEHRAILRQGPGASNGRWNTPAMKVLTLLVESGAVYCLIIAIALTNNIVSHSKPVSLTPSGAAFLSATTVFLSGCFVPVLAIYPTFIIFIVAVDRSLVDGTLANAGSPSAIPSHVLHSIHFRNSSATIDVPLTLRDAGRWHDSEHGNFSNSDCAALQVQVGGASTGDDSDLTRAHSEAAEASDLV